MLAWQLPLPVLEHLPRMNLALDGYWHDPYPLGTTGYARGEGWKAVVRLGSAEESKDSDGSWVHRAVPKSPFQP